MQNFQEKSHILYVFLTQLKSHYLMNDQLDNRYIKTKLPSQSVFTFSKLTIETLEQGVKYVQSLQ